MCQTKKTKVISRVSAYIFCHKFLFGGTLTLACLMTILSVLAPSVIQKVLDDVPDTPSTESPNGEATIETYTVLYGRDNQPQQGVVIGRLGELGDPKAERFVAMVDDESDVLEKMTQEDMIGSSGLASRGDKLNKFILK